MRGRVSALGVCGSDGVVVSWIGIGRIPGPLGLGSGPLPFWKTAVLLRAMSSECDCAKGSRRNSSGSTCLTNI